MGCLQCPSALFVLQIRCSAFMWDLPDSTQAEDMFKVLLSTIRCGYQRALQPALQE